MKKYSKKILLLLFSLVSISLCFIILNNKKIDNIEEKFYVSDIDNSNISLYIDNNESSYIPDTNIYFLDSESSYCTNNETISWDYNTKTLSISSLSKKTECVIHLTSGYKESILNGNDPVLSSNMIPVIINDDNTVKYASLGEKWYEYSNKIWANSVILIDNPSKTYNEGDIIIDSDIKGYFVWIPKYEYQIFNLGLYDNVETSTDVENKINIRFSNDITDNTSTCDYLSSNCEVGNWIVHSSFVNTSSRGIWVSKYQSKINNEDIIVNRNSNVYFSNFYDLFLKSYNYDRDNDSHMIKNSEWASVLYLAYSEYGSYTDSLTTGNNSGIFDMNNEYSEFVSAYTSKAILLDSMINLDDYDTKYFDIYDSENIYDYNKRILGDATGEMGPFDNEYLSSFAKAHIEMPSVSLPFLSRGKSNEFSSYATTSESDNNTTSRIVLITK